MRALGTPDGCDLYGTEDVGQFPAIRGEVASKRNSEVESKAEVGKIVCVTGCVCRGQIVGTQPALEHAERQLLVVATEAGVQALVVLNDGRLNFFEPVCRVRLANDGECTLTASFFAREKVAHASRCGHVVRHATSLT